MELSTKTARQLYEEMKQNITAPRYGFGKKPMLVNVDLQRRHTDAESFRTAYGNPEQLAWVNRLVALFRSHKLPIVWSHTGYMASAEDCGVWALGRPDTADALQNLKTGSPRAELDSRLDVDYTHDILVHKRMPSSFHETNLRSLLVWHNCDTIIVTGGSTSGCIRATVVDGLSSGYRMIVPEECVADRHEGPHYANLYDMAEKYADVLPVAMVIDYLQSYKSAT